MAAVLHYKDTLLHPHGFGLAVAAAALQIFELEALHWLTALLLAAAAAVPDLTILLVVTMIRADPEAA
jgi:hypothetical protein